ncbi:MAG: sigma-70 family RNA polymerase sigma factor [Candidatus Paceibacterota bacterium]
MNKVERNFLSAYDSYSAAILRHIYFKVSDMDVAEDLTQETFFKTWQYVAAGKEIKNIKTFLYTVAGNLIIDHYRQKPRAAISLDDVSQKEISYEPQQEKETEQKIAAVLARKYLSWLEKEQREIIYCRYVDEMSIEEISEITGKTPNNVRVSVHRAMKILREKIKNV